MKTFVTLALLMVSATTAYAQSPSSAVTSSPMRTTVKWEVQGWSGDTVLLVGDNGDTRTARVGDLMDGCLVSAEKVVCDPAEKRAIEDESRTAKEKETVLKAAPQAQLKQETDRRKALTAAADDSKKRIEVLKGEVEQKSLEAAEHQKQITALKAQVDKMEKERSSDGELVLKKERDFADFAWTEANVESIGKVMYADAGMVGLMKVELTNGEKAEAVLNGAVRNKQVQGNYVYFTLSKDMLQIEKAR